MKLICPNQSLFSPEIKKKLSKRFKCNFSDLLQKSFDKVVSDHEIVLCRFSKNIKYFNNHKIRYILSPTTGTNHIDRKFLQDKKVKIITLKNEFSFLKDIHASSELTVLLILYFLRKINKIKNHKKIIQIGNEISGKKIGIIGYGRIGRKVSKILSSFGAKIFFHDKKKIKNKKPLNFILKNCDIISIHIPLNTSNEKFLDKQKIDKIKKNSLLVNTSRGEIVDENYLINKLKKNKLSYATDVISKENDSKKNKLINLELKIDNLVITPHIGGLTEESIKKTDIFILKKFLKYYEK